MAQSIQVYYGEFTISPIPLELSLIEPCDYACAYCFAVLGDRHLAWKKGKSAASNSTKMVMSLLSSYHKRKNLTAKLLRDGYPVLMSNRTDPFGRVNRNTTIPVLEVMAELGIPVAFQTKGFTNENDLDTVLQIISPSCWYISIAFWDDSTRKKVEPGATTIQHRLDLICRLREAGHEVIVGINPCVPEFLPNPLVLLKELKQRGVWGVWIERLHLDHWLEKQMRQREKDALGQTLIERAKSRKSPKLDFDHIMKTRAIAQELGLEVYGMGQANRSNFWAPYRRLYPRTFPTIQDFINHWHDRKLPDGSLLSFDSCAEAFLPHLPEGIHQLGHYIGATTRQICRERKGYWTDWMNYETLLKMCWTDARIKMAIPNNLPFSYAVEGDAVLLDERQLPYMVWKASGHQDLYVRTGRKKEIYHRILTK